MSITIHVQLEDASFLNPINCYTVSPFRYNSNDTDYNRNRAAVPVTNHDVPTTDNWVPACTEPGDPEPHTHHVINGIFYCHLPDIVFDRGEKILWLVAVLGDMVRACEPAYYYQAQGWGAGGGGQSAQHATHGRARVLGCDDPRSQADNRPPPICRIPHTLRTAGRHPSGAIPNLTRKVQ